MKKCILFFFLFFAASVMAQKSVKLYDELCDPLQAVFCDYVRNESYTGYILTPAGEYRGTLIDNKLYGWGMFISNTGARSYGQFRNGKLLFGIVLSGNSAKVGGEDFYVVYDIRTGGISRMHVPEGDVRLRPPFVKSADGDPSPYSFGKVTYDNGNVYTGEFYNGKRHGYGLLERPDGDVWYGQFREDYRFGYGVLIKADKHVEYGKWAGDIKVE